MTKSSIYKTIIRPIFEQKLKEYGGSNHFNGKLINYQL